MPMTNPNTLLKEKTRLEEKAFPFRPFINACPAARAGQMILYLHWHEHFEIIMMRQGRAIFHIDSHPYEANEGDVLLVPAGSLHVGYSLYDGPTDFISIVFNGALFNDWAHDPLHAEHLSPYLEGASALPVRPDAALPSVREHYGLLQTALREFEEKKPAYQLVIKTQLYLLFTYLARALISCRPAEKPPARFSFNREHFKPFIRYIETHFADKLTVADAASRLNMDPFHFCKTFKRLTGRTFVEYVNVCRANEAERLLLETDLTVTQIAGLVGCDNPNYFTRMFKQYKGIAPSQLRKNTSP